MMLAYVLGRPMPSASSLRTSVASVYRAGGLVSWPTGSSSLQARPSPSRRAAAARLPGRRGPLGVVDPFDVGAEEAGELDVPAGGAELGVAGGDRHRVETQPRLGHLRGDRPLPDHVVQAQLAAGEASSSAGLHLGAGGADGFVGFLGVFDLVGVLPRLRG